MNYEISEVEKDREFTESMMLAVVLFDSVKGIEIKTDADEVIGISFGKQITEAEKKIKEQQKKWTAGAKSFIETVNDLVKPKLITLESIKITLNNKMRAFRQEKEIAAEKERQKEAERVRKLEEKQKAKIEQAIIESKPAPVLKPIFQKDIRLDKTIRTEAGKVTYKTLKKYEIIDESLIPRQFLTPDLGKIQKARQADIEIPGVRFYTEQTPVY